jgi:DNA mismatch repair protein MutS2
MKLTAQAQHQQRLTSLDWLEVLQQIQSFATSGSGKLQIADLAPLARRELAEASFRRILDAAEILGTGTRPYFESLDLFDSWHSRLRRKAVLKTLEIKDVRLFCLETLALREAIESIEAGRNQFCTDLQSLLMNAEEPLSAIDQILTPGGEIRMDASETLYRLFKEKEFLSKQVETTLDKLVKDHQMNNLLQDKYVTTREGRWVLPIKGGMQHFMPGVIHGSSQTKQTVFMEPDTVIPLNNRLRQIETEIEDEIERLLAQLSEYLWSMTSAFGSTHELLLETDVLLAKAQWSERVEARAVQFSDQEILLIEVKHPLLVLAGKPVVANTVRMTQEKRILLLSGPNAGGKTVLLKSIGLAAQMARCGLLISAGEGSVLPFFEQIHIGIGDSQSVGEELSTFAAHLKVLDQASKLKGSGNLILVDEICGSTDPEEGSALARSFIEGFAKNESFAVITSHLGPLKAGWKPEDPILNGSLEYDLESGKPTYQFLSGIPGDSLAIQTAKRVGVAESIWSRAVELLSPASRARLAGLEEIDQIKNDIQTLREHLKKDSQRAKNEKDKYESLIQSFEKEKETLLRKAQRDAEKKIEEMISAAKAEETFKRHRNLQEIKTQLPEIIKSRPGPGDSSASSAPDSAEDFAKKFPPGSKIFVPTLQQDGIIQSSPNNKGEVLVLANSLRLSLPWQDLRGANKATNPTAELVRRSAGQGSTGFSVALQDHEKTVDLRGKTVAEALEELESELDNSASHREDRIKVIHGHGTEALKKAVRTYLSRSVYVKKWKSGSPEQGGDGITWAELNQER